MEWLVVEDISGEVPRLEAIEFSVIAAMMLIRCTNVRAIWRISDDSKEHAIEAVMERLECGANGTQDANVIDFEEACVAAHRQILINALEQCNYNISEAAAMINVNRKTIYRYVPIEVIANNRRQVSSN